MNKIAIFAQQSKLTAKITDNMREQIKTLKAMKDLPKEEKEKLAKTEEDFADYMNKAYDLEIKIDKIILKVE